MSDSMEQKSECLLIGNSFPLSLVRRAVRIIPQPLSMFREKARISHIASFWGHDSTLSAANAVLGVDIRPKPGSEGERPALRLSAEGLPVLEDQTFRECWVLSPEYVPGFRPAIGMEVPPEKILGWQVLLITWENLPAKKAGGNEPGSPR